MIKKILAALAAAGAFFSAVFFVLFKQAKLEHKLEQAESEKEDAARRENQINVVRGAENAVHKSIAEQEAENEELVERATAGNSLNSFNAGLDLLRKQSESGDKRNSRAGSARA